MRVHRRNFMKVGAGIGLTELLGWEAWGELRKDMEDSSAPIPKRRLGATGADLSVVGFGGIVVVGLSQKEADRYVSEAFDRGVNYYDVAPSYGAGEAELKLGPALKPYRDKSFLACKTQKRDKAGAATELRHSLKMLRTDHFDLYQMHAIRDVETDVGVALGPGGAIEAFLEAREQGLVRHIGFSSHSVEAALKAIETGLFDTVLHPVNFVCHHGSDFNNRVLEAARAKDMGLLALKSMAKTSWPEGTKKEGRENPKCWYEPLNDPALAALALRWTLSQNVTAMLPPGDEKLFKVALNVASKDKPLSETEGAALQQIAAATEPIFPRPDKKRKASQKK